MFDYGKRFKKGFFLYFFFLCKVRYSPVYWTVDNISRFRCCGSGSGMHILDHISKSLETIFWVKILEFFDADSDPGSGNFFDPEFGMEKFRFWIRDKHPESATVVDLSKFLLFSQADNGECYFPPFVGLRLLF